MTFFRWFMFKPLYLHTDKGKHFQLNLMYHHFVISPWNDRVSPFFSNFALLGLKDYIVINNEEKDPILMGIFLHAVQDSYSHEGFTWKWSYINFNPKIFWNPIYSLLLPPIGQAQFRHRPGKTYEKPGKALAMAQTTYLILAGYSKKSSIPEFSFDKLKEIFSEKSSKLKMSEKWIELIKSEFPQARAIGYNKDVASVMLQMEMDKFNLLKSLKKLNFTPSKPKSIVNKGFPIF